MPTDTPVYIYAFCDAAPDTAPHPIPGLKDAPIRFLEHAGITAAVSDAPGPRVRPQRSLLAAHQRVLKTLAEHVSTLPAAFGLIADREPDLAAAMTAGADSLTRELDRVAGCVELEVRLSWDVENVFEHLVAIDEDLAARRDELAAWTDQHGEAPHDLKVAVGRRVDKLISAHRAHAERVLATALAPLARELETQAVAEERALARLACLVDKSDAEDFESAVHEAAAEFDDSHVLAIGGPFAPHSFVDLRLDLAGHAEVA